MAKQLRQSSSWPREKENVKRKIFKESQSHKIPARTSIKSRPWKAEICLEYKIVFESLRYAKGKKIEHLRYANREPNSKLNTYEQGTKLKVIISDQ